MRLRVPLGYGVAEGATLRTTVTPARRNSVSTHPWGWPRKRWATVVRTQIHLGGGEDHLDVGVVLDETPTGMHAWDARSPSV